MEIIGEQHMENTAGSKLWHVVFTNVAKEFSAQMDLDACGFPTFLPTERKLVTRGRRRHEVERPLFPRYFFAVIPNTKIINVMQTRHVHSLVPQAGGLATIRDDIIQDLRELDSAGEFDDANLVPPELKAGDRARIKSGPLAGIIVRLKSVDGPARCKILFDLVDSQREASIPLANLERSEYG